MLFEYGISLAPNLYIFKGAVHQYYFHAKPFKSAINEHMQSQWQNIHSSFVQLLLVIQQWKQFHIHTTQLVFFISIIHSVYFTVGVRPYIYIYGIMRTIVMYSS